MTDSREGDGDKSEESRTNTIGVSKNTPIVLEISFGVLHFSAGMLKGKSAGQTGEKCLCKRERDVG